MTRAGVEDEPGEACEGRGRRLESARWWRAGAGRRRGRRAHLDDGADEVQGVDRLEVEREELARVEHARLGQAVGGGGVSSGGRAGAGGRDAREERKRVGNRVVLHALNGVGDELREGATTTSEEPTWPDGVSPSLAVLITLDSRAGD